MKVFTYSLFHKIMYRYGNIPVTVLLIIYLIPAVVDLDRNLLYFIPVVLLLGIIYLLNKHYLNLYKILPYRIETDNEKMICTDFIFSKKEFIIYFRDIESLTGGIFDGRLAGLMKVCDKNNNVCVGFFNQLKNAGDLETILLSKVPLEVYNRVVEKVGLKKKKGDKKK